MTVISQEGEWDHHDALEVTQEHPALLNECLDLDSKFCFVWDAEHEYMQIPYG